MKGQAEDEGSGFSDKLEKLSARIRETVSGEIMMNEPLSKHTSLKIGGPVSMLVFPEDPMSLQNILTAAAEEDVPVFMIGAGTNLLVKDGGVDGIAISLDAFNQVRIAEETDDSVTLFIGAGVSLGKLINFTKEKGYSGIEALAGIPGSFGGAVYMNAGSFGVEIKDVIVSIAIMNRYGKIAILKMENLRFSYRNSNLPEGLAILSANIKLRKADAEEVQNKVSECLQKKRLTQPLGEPSAGCVFKNPEAQSAGRLIELAGCKGMRSGDAEVSWLHANYLINRGNAKSKDFIKLMDMVRDKVQEHSGITLEPEIKIIGKN
ncbi:MAG: UDP-N-acetylmuramate dehydrogenase [Thermodesulfovibrionia bacterium]|nr:UDP-N-acetylmuramate dehydrogenase [Thermodesulfovibrionia bacterium]